MTTATAPVETATLDLEAPAAGKNIAMPATTKPNAGDPFMEMCQRALTDPNINLEAMEKLLEMRNRELERDERRAEKQRDWEAEQAFNRDFVNAQRLMPQVAKTAWNEQTNSHYAKMEDVEAAIKPIFTEHGFGMMFRSGGSPIDEDHVHSICELIHRDGHSRTFEDQVPLAGLGMKGTRMMTKTHGYGATKTYARRYMTLDIWDVKVMDQDSDGNINNNSGEIDGFREKIDEARGDKARLTSIYADLNTNTTLDANGRTAVKRIFNSAWAELPEEVKRNG